jgi:hypothetical protein
MGVGYMRTGTGGEIRRQSRHGLGAPPNEVIWHRSAASSNNVAAGPADQSAVDRLAQLAEKDGRSADAAELTAVFTKLAHGKRGQAPGPTVLTAVVTRAAWAGSQSPFSSAVRHAMVSRCNRRKSEILRLKARYAKLYERRQPVRNAIEMARLAEKLGRDFEARAFYTVAIAENRDGEDLRRELRRLIEGRRIFER